MDIPDPDRQEAGTTASEFDGALDDAEDEDNPENMEDVEVNDKSDEEGSATKQKNVKKVCD